MVDYVKPYIRESNPGHISFHVGSNEIPSYKNPNTVKPPNSGHALNSGQNV